MAARTELDVIVSAQVQHQEQIAKLINDVGKLQAQMKQFESASGKMAGGVRKGTKALDEQSKAMRNHRMGVQQAGMQVNDFFTSVSSGTSPIQAFNQQIGQLGYAMSMMKGRFAAVGAFLAGPWGGAITVATMLLGAFVEGLIENEDKLKKTELASNQLGEAQSILGDIFDLTTGKIKEQNPVLLANARAKIALAKIDAARELAAGKEEIRTIRKGRIELQGGMGGGLRLARVGDNTQEILDRFQKGVNTYSQALYQLQNKLDSGSITDDEFTRAVTAIDKVSMAAENLKTFEEAENGINGATDALTRFLKPAKENDSSLKRQQERLKSLTERLRDYILIHTAATDEIGKTQKKLDDFNDLVKELEGLPGGAAVVKELAAQIEAVRHSILNEGAEKALAQFNAEIDKLLTKDLSPFERQIKPLLDSLKNPELGLKPEDTARYYEALQNTAESYFKSAIDGQQDLLDKTLGVDNSYNNLRQSLLDIIIQMQAAGAATEDLEMMLARFDKLHSDIKIAERNAEIRKSFESIGQSVSNAFQGMLTAGMSWKEGMKGIIQSVINELWKLYVVQQIVGFVKSALGSITGAPVSDGNRVALPAYAGMKAATGGYPQQNKPVLVGERGPELFIPSSSGKIVANHNLGTGGGGMVINVDARGSSDPAAVRAQVQQGILEAAPAIIAAAEQRTVSNLRRPRLGGAMQ